MHHRWQNLKRQQSKVKRNLFNSKNGLWFIEIAGRLPASVTAASRGAGCKVKEQHLIQLLRTIKEYYPAFPYEGTLDVEVWEDVGKRLTFLQDNGVTFRTRSLITWGLVRTALLPIWAKIQELVTEEDKESSSEEEVMYDVVEEPAMKVLPTAPPEDRLIAIAPYFNSTLGALTPLQNDSPPREPENSDRYPVCDSAFGRQRRLEI